VPVKMVDWDTVPAQAPYRPACGIFDDWATLELLRRDAGCDARSTWHLLGGQIATGPNLAHMPTQSRGHGTRQPPHIVAASGGYFKSWQRNLHRHACGSEAGDHSRRIRVPNWWVRQTFEAGSCVSDGFLHIQWLTCLLPLNVLVEQFPECLNSSLFILRLREDNIFPTP